METPVRGSENPSNAYNDVEVTIMSQKTAYLDIGC